MTSVSLHPVPTWSAVGREQMRAVGLALRAEVLLVLALLVAFYVMSVVMSFRAAGNPHMNVGFGYGPAASIPTSILALLIPFGVWRSEEPSRRDYHWSMPVDQTGHTLLKVLYGWIWLMLLVAAFVVFLLGLWANAAVIAGESVHVNAAPWEWLVPFTAATVAYLLTSVLVVGTDHPWRWITGIALAFLFVFAFFSAAGLDSLRRAETDLLNGYYGLNSAIFGQVERYGSRGASSVERWFGATALWLGIAVLGVYLVSKGRGARG